MIRTWVWSNIMRVIKKSDYVSNCLEKKLKKLVSFLVIFALITSAIKKADLQVQKGLSFSKWHICTTLSSFINFSFRYSETQVVKST